MNTARQLKIEIAEDYPDQGFWDVYFDPPKVIQPTLEELRALTDRLATDPRIRLWARNRMTWSATPDYMDSYALLPRDAWHLTTMARCSADAIVTTDDDFPFSRVAEPVETAPGPGQPLSAPPPLGQPMIRASGGE